MTYNFDPDKWYENELYMIQSELKIGEITQEEYQHRVKDLDEKLEEMWKRLDGSYQLDT